jgi:hypothetical protein
MLGTRFLACLGNRFDRLCAQNKAPATIIMILAGAG